jgi:surface protein
MSVENYSDTLLWFLEFVEADDNGTAAGEPAFIDFTAQAGLQYNTAAKYAREKLAASYGWLFGLDTGNSSLGGGATTATDSYIYEEIPTSADLRGPLVFTVTPDESATMTNLPLDAAISSSLVWFDVEDEDGNSVLADNKFIDGSDYDYTLLEDFVSVNLVAGTTYRFEIYASDAENGLRFAGWDLYTDSEGNNPGATIEILAFNDFPLSKLGFQFQGFRGSLAHASTDTPTILQGTSLESCFQGATFTTFPGLDSWAMESVTSLASAFEGCTNFNQDIGSWTTSEVTTLEAAFKGCTAINQLLVDWDTSKVTSLRSTFEDCVSLNRNFYITDTRTWDTTNVTDASSMFRGCTTMGARALFRITGTTTDLSFMFDSCTQFSGTRLQMWAVQNVTSFEAIFKDCAAFDQAISAWDISSATNMARMFQGATIFNDDITTWNVSSVVTMENMFSGAASFNRDVGLWDVQNVTTMKGMFEDATSFNVDLWRWKDNYGGTALAKVVDFSYFLSGASGFTQAIDWNLGPNLTTMRGMFANSGLSSTTFSTTVANFRGSVASASTPTGVNFRGQDGMEYTTAGLAARQILKDTYGWLFEEIPTTSISATATATLYGPVLFTVTIGSADVTMTNLPLASGSTIDASAIWFDVENAQGNSVLAIPLVTYADDSGDDYTRLDAFSSVVLVKNTTYTFEIFSSDESSGLSFQGWNVYDNNGANLTLYKFNGFPLATTGSQFVYFSGATAVDLDAPTIRTGTSLYECFRSSSFETFGGLESWSTVGVTNMSRMFIDNATFNQDLNGWDTSSVTTFFGCFKGCAALDQNFDAWNVSAATDMTTMFRDCTKLGETTEARMFVVTAATTSLWLTFSGCPFMNSPEISSWAVDNVSDFRDTFRSCSAFDQNISGWDVASATTFANMFNGCLAFNQDISAWNVSSATTFADMFHDAVAFNQDISTWDVSSATTFADMFHGASAFDQNLGAWAYDADADPVAAKLGASVGSMRGMFASSGMSPWNFSDTLVDFYNSVDVNGLPTGVDFRDQENMVYHRGAEFSADQLFENYGWLIDSPLVLKDHVVYEEDYGCPGYEYAPATTGKATLSVDVPDIVIATDRVTVEFTMKFEEVSRAFRLFALAAGAAETYGIVVFRNSSSTNFFRLRLVDVDDSRTSADFSLAEHLGVYSHFVLSSNPGEEMTFSVNGIRVAEVSLAGLSFTAPMTTLQLGGDVNRADSSSRGLVQDLRLYDWAYDAIEGDVQTLFTNAGVCASTVGSVLDQEVAGYRQAAQDWFPDELDENGNFVSESRNNGTDDEPATVAVTQPGEDGNEWEFRADQSFDGLGIGGKNPTVPVRFEPQEFGVYKIRYPTNKFLQTYKDGNDYRSYAYTPSEAATATSSSSFETIGGANGGGGDTYVAAYAGVNPASGDNLYRLYKGASATACANANHLDAARNDREIRERVVDGGDSKTETIGLAFEMTEGGKLETLCFTDLIIDAVV